LIATGDLSVATQSSQNGSGSHGSYVGDEGRQTHSPPDSRTLTESLRASLPGHDTCDGDSQATVYRRRSADNYDGYIDVEKDRVPAAVTWGAGVTHVA